jgi:trypsin
VIKISVQLSITPCILIGRIWPFSLSVRVGSNTVTEGGQVIGVAEVHQHPLFDVSTMDYDISILRLAHPINYSPSAMPIGLVPSDYKISPDANFIVTGWGTLTEGGDLPSQLQVVKIPYLSNEQCQKAYGQEMTISARMFCAAASGKDSCQVFIHPLSSHP